MVSSTIMNKPNQLNKQKGTFSIEFTLVATGFILILAFTSDVVANISTKGRLDRLSYSIVSVLKERTQLYNESDVLQSAQIDQMYSLVNQILTRSMGNYDPNKLGMYFEQQKFDNKKPVTPLQNIHLFSRGQFSCQPVNSLHSLETLSPTTTWGRRGVLYQVTICYQGENWFGQIMNDDFSLIRSTSIMLGR